MAVAVGICTEFDILRPGYRADLEHSLQLALCLLSRPMLTPSHGSVVPKTSLLDQTAVKRWCPCCLLSHKVPVVICCATRGLRSSNCSGTCFLCHTE